MIKKVVFHIDKDYFIWEDNFYIFTEEDKHNLIIKANKDGLISLARHFITLMNRQNYEHLHLDEFNSLEDGSCEIILQKNNLKDKLDITNNEIIESKEKDVKIVIEYEKNIKINHQEECYIEVDKQGETFLIDANDTGLLTLAKYFLILSQPEFSNNEFILMDNNMNNGYSFLIYVVE